MRIEDFIYRVACVAVAGSLLGACTSEDDELTNYNGEKVPMTFTAGSVQTRTALGDDGTAVNWVKGDAIAIFDGTETNEFTTQDAGASVTFTGTAHQADTYTAFYPFGNVTEITATTITFNLPGEQTAVSGSFASGLVPSWAQTAEGSTSLQFKNLSALVKFTVGNGMAGEGTFILRGVKGESLAGTMTYTIGESTQAEVSADAPLNEIKLKGTFEAGKTYYFTVAPAALSEGLSLFYVNSEGTAYRRGGNKAVTLEAGKVLDLGEQTSAKFEEAIINLELIEQIESNLPSGGGKKMASAEGVEITTKAANDVALYDSGTGFVKNPDGTVTLTDENRNIISGVTYVSFYDIKNVSGLEYFTNVTEFYCEWVTEQESLDLTALKNLASINCNSCDILTSLNVSGLDKLNYINIKNCPLTSLDLTGLTSLTTLYMGETELTSLELSHLTNLSSLECTDCKLQSLNVSGLTNLTWLVCANTQVESLDLRGLTKLSFLQCTGNRLTSLDLTDQKECLTTLLCYDNNLGSLELSDLTKLQRLECYNIGAASLTLSDLPALTELNCGENQLTSLSLSDLPKLATLRCNKNRLTSLSLSNLPALIYLSCIDNQLTSLDVSGLTKLEDLYCYNNQLTSLDVSNLTALTRLYCYNNQLTSLDVSNLTALTRLYCYNNQLTTLSVGDINTLKFVECHQNQLSQINLANMANLSNLKCGQQTNADGTSLTATLEIYSTKIGTWNTTWSQYPENANITLKQ